MKIEATPAQVREVVARLVPTSQATSHGWTKFYAVCDAAREMGGDGGWPGDQFAGQVGRALEGLVQEGVLAKIKRGERGPHSGGWATVNEPTFYTPAALSDRTVEADLAVQRLADTNDLARRLAAKAQRLGLEIVALEPKYGRSQITLHVPQDVLATLLDAYETTVSAGHGQPAGA